MTSKEPCLNSKKIVLSLATISFLASCANAALNSEIKTYDEANKNLKARSAASVYSPQARIDTTINSSHDSKIEFTDQGPHTIIIEAGGTLGSIGNTDRIIYAHVNNSNTLTLTNLTNKGTINGKVAVEHDQGFTGTITVNTFENTGQINGQIYMGIWGGNSGTLSIDKFTNSGTIAANTGNAVFFEGANANVKNFTNTGNILGQSGNGVFIKSSIDNFTNKGTIKSTGNGEPSVYGASTGVKLQTNTIKTFINEGLISAIVGVDLTQGNIENFINKGTIESTSSSNFGAAINLSAFYGNPSIIDNFTNEGTIKSNSNGILSEAGNKINTLINKGSIEVSLNGISFYDNGDAGGSGNKI
ncbi:hypothetical protein RZX05_000572, partial [Campylobacter jejuni]|nr:hypothetical protein [Campylobacter jejuni]